MITIFKFIGGIQPTLQPFFTPLALHSVQEEMVKESPTCERRGANLGFSAQGSKR